MNEQRSQAVMKYKQLDRQYSKLSRENLIGELAAAEKVISSEEISEELKFLYQKKYMKILESLMEKLENFEKNNLNKKVC